MEQDILIWVIFDYAHRWKLKLNPGTGQILIAVIVLDFRIKTKLPKRDITK